MAGNLDTSPLIGERVYDAIYTAIINGQYPAGTRLQIRNLAHTLGTSVMPVREALSRLEAVGLVETRPYKGAEVKALSREELLDIYSVRRLLEVQAARLGVANMDGEAVAGLRASLDRMRAALDAGDVAGYLDADEAFLAKIFRGANSPVLLQYVQSLWNRCRHYKIIGVEEQLARGSADELLEFQSRLLAASEAHDAERAAQVAAESVDAAITRIESGLYERATRG